jgi:hypothetical protein
MCLVMNILQYKQNKIEKGFTQYSPDFVIYIKSKLGKTVVIVSTYTFEQLSVHSENAGLGLVCVVWLDV